MADPRRLRELLGFGYGAPSPAMSALEPFHAGVDPAYMPQDVVTASPTEGPRGWVRSGLESLFGAIAPSERAASNMAEKVTNLSDFVNVPQEAFDIGTEIGNTLQGGDPRMLAMSLLPGKAADELVPAVKAAQKAIRGYHGSKVPGLTEFDPSKMGTATDAGQLGQGIYLSTDRRVAEGYPHQYEADVGLSNPLQLSMPDWRTDKSELVKAELGLPKAADAAAISEALRERGHDGVVLDYSPAGYAHQEMMVLDPKNASIVPAVKAAQKQIRAYHGTPHDFERFDLSKIGTGEGAQAYGHGLYFAENEGVAKDYRNKLADRPKVLAGGEEITPTTGLGIFNKTDADATVAARLSSWAKAQTVTGSEQATAAEAAAKVRADLENGMRLAQEKGNFDLWSSLNDQKLSLQRMEERGLDLKHGGHMYEVNINADPDAFLDWDKPLSEQPAAKDALLGLLPPPGTSGYYDDRFLAAPTKEGGYEYKADVGRFINELGKGNSTKFTEAMREKGIPGIKYLDAGSRGGDGTQGSRNYVVFSDEIIDIVKKYGIAGALGAGLITQQMADQLQAQQGGGQS